jgi:hypothetical protein
MPRRSLPHPLAHGAFRAAEAVDAGVPRSRLRADDIGHPHHGLYLPRAAELQLFERCAAFAALLGPDRWFSHLTAARLRGIPLPMPWTPDEPLHVLAMSDAAPTRRPDVVGWESERSDFDREVIGLIPLVGPAEAWCQLSVPGSTGTDAATGRKRNLNEAWLVAAADYVLTGPRIDGRNRPLCTRKQLEAAIRKRRGARGVKALVRALVRARPGAQSPKETKLRLGLVECGLPEPVTQFPVMTAEGLRHADLGYDEARVLLEYQGDQHRTDRRQWLRDLTRVQLFQDAGYHVILVGAHDLEPDCSALADRVRRALSHTSFGT